MFVVKFFSTMLVTALVTIGVTGCGSSPSPSVAIAIRTDASLSNRDEGVRTAYVTSARSHATELYDRGGSLRLDVFAGSPRSVELLSKNLEPGLGDVRRAREIVPLRATVEQGLAEALGLRTARPQIAQAIHDLTQGSDVVGNLAAAVKSVQGAPNAQVLLLTDGEDQRFRRGASAAEMLASIRPVLPTNARGVRVAILGIGGTRRGGASAESTERLVEAWTRACEYTGAACQVSADVNPDANPSIGQPKGDAR